MDIFQLTRTLVDISSITGQEREIGEFLVSFLEGTGWSCRTQEVGSDRFNVLAVWDQPVLLLTTHMDTVPPFFASSEDEYFIYGRGACDAKGIAAAMIVAAQQLIGDGEKDIALLFVVGEEIDSAGALKACEMDFRCSYFIDGEPTDNQLVVAHKGIVSARLSTQGISAHSAYPERGDSAIDKLVDVLNGLKETHFPVHERFGKTSVNVGTIRGGRASNVVADQAEAEVLIRTVSESRRYVELLERVVAGRGEVEICKTTEPQEMESVDGFPTKTVSYGTDIPALRPLGKPLLFGPGSILDAHTSDEKIAKKELVEGVSLYQTLIRQLKATKH